MRILCIGDSNTYGFDPRSIIDSRYPEEIRWADQLSGHNVVNFGINGMTIPGDHSVFTDLIKRKDPDLVIVMLGTNDLLEGADAAETAKRMDSFIESLHEMRKPILLIAPPVLKYGEWVPDEKTVEESQKIGGLYQKIAAKYGCRFADSGKWDVELTFDGVHLSPAGHDTFAQKLNECI